MTADARFVGEVRNWITENTDNWSKPMEEARSLYCHSCCSDNEARETEVVCRVARKVDEAIPKVVLTLPLHGTRRRGQRIR